MPYRTDPRSELEIKTREALDRLSNLGSPPGCVEPVARVTEDVLEGHGYVPERHFHLYNVKKLILLDKEIDDVKGYGGVCVKLYSHGDALVMSRRFEAWFSNESVLNRLHKSPAWYELLFNEDGKDDLAEAREVCSGKLKEYDWNDLRKSRPLSLLELQIIRHHASQRRSAAEARIHAMAKGERMQATYPHNSAGNLQRAIAYANREKQR
ncbi:hypothetical protein ACFL3V_00665 [Nanoarchaeota archaeon]